MSKACEDKIENSFNNLKQEETDYSTFFDKLYVERTHSYRAKELVRLFELNRNHQTTLFSGQVGCGKTTELHSVKSLLEKSTKKKIPRFFYFSISRWNLWRGSKLHRYFNCNFFRIFVEHT